MVTHSRGMPITVDGVLRHLPSLRLFATTSTGVIHIGISECHSRGISVTNAGNVISEGVADMAVYKCLVSMVDEKKK
ncbi:D-isomer specific 2-hydroxyacid dehydrogenase, catalytic domain [Dillenia turbinata]|uniref:D-isomer specific 2-hydroxyacid dehydrogenase, catalytic domain n=1 Tax=Dillenia turbinata TaxID=194707 RepID=A0AAN8UMV3_9MAGN